jgi:hypothetical protein
VISFPTWVLPWRGTIGIAPSANISPTREYPSMFEPVHGSAPDIAGQGIAKDFADYTDYNECAVEIAKSAGFNSPQLVALR